MRVNYTKNFCSLRLHPFWHITFTSFIIGFNCCFNFLIFDEFYSNKLIWCIFIFNFQKPTDFILYYFIPNIIILFILNFIFGKFYTQFFFIFLTNFPQISFSFLENFTPIFFDQFYSQFLCLLMKNYWTKIC